MKEAVAIEEGVLTMNAGRSQKNSHRWYCFEIFENSKAQQLHGTMPYFKSYQEATAAMVDKKSVAFYQVDILFHRGGLSYDKRE